MISFCWSRSQDVYLASSCILPFRLGRSFQVCYWPSEKDLIPSGNPRPCWPTESVRVHKKCDIAMWKCSPSGEVAEVGVHGRTVLFFSVCFFLQSRWWSRWLLQTLRELIEKREQYWSSHSLASCAWISWDSGSEAEKGMNTLTTR